MTERNPNDEDRLLRVYKPAIRNAISLLLLTAAAAAFTGYWAVAFVCLVLMTALATWLGSRRVSFDASNRSTFPIALEIAGVGSSALPRGCLTALLPGGVMIAAFSGATPYIRAAKRGETGLAWLIDQMRSPEESVRWRALTTLGTMGKGEGAAAVAKALKDSSPLVREAAVLAMSRLGGDQFIEVSFDEEVDDRVWLQAAAAARRKGRAFEIPEWRLNRVRNLIRTEEDWDETTGEAIGMLPAAKAYDLIFLFLRRGGSSALRAAQALGAQRNPEAKKLLLALLEDPRLPMKRLALHGLQSLRDPSTIRHVEPYQNCSEPDLEQLARLVVANLERVAAQDAPQ